MKVTCRIGAGVLGVGSGQPARRRVRRGSQRPGARAGRRRRRSRTSRVVVAPVEPEMPMGPLSVARDASLAPETLMARADDVSVDARLLVITADGTSAAFAAITTALDYLGTPYDVFNASTGPDADRRLPGRRRSRPLPRHLLDSGDLAVGSSSAFSDAEWMALASYEARFGVRRAVAYAHPVRRVRAGADRRLRRPGRSDRRALHGRRQRRLRGRELRGAGRDRRRLGVRQPARRRVHAAAAGRRGGQRLRGDAQLRRRPRGAGADVRAVADRVSHARARLRRRRAG